MKVLRLFAVEHFAHRTEFVHSKNQTEHRYQKRQISRDFAQHTPLDKAKLALYQEFGMPPELCEYKYPPDGFVRIMHHTICDDSPEIGKIEAERTSEQDLFSGMDMKAAQSKKPKPKPWT